MFLGSFGPVALNGEVLGPSEFISAAGDNYTTSTTPTLSYTVAAGANCLIVSFCTRDSDVVQAVSGVTYNGVSLTLAIEDTSYSGSSTTDYASIWYLQNPPVGVAHDIVATITSGAPGLSWIVGISAKEVSSLVSTDSDADAASDTTGVGTLTNTQPGTLIVGTTCINVNDPTIVWTSDGPTITEVYAHDSGPFSTSTAYGTDTGSTTVVVTATHSSATRPAAVFARFRP